MKKFVLIHIILFFIFLVSFSYCKNPTRDDSMQPYDGYPLLDNIDSIKKELASRCIDTIEFKKGEIVADIGAGNGYLEGMLTLFTDSVTFYIQDIDTSICNQLTVNQVVDFYKNLNKKPFTNKLIPVNGSDSTTNLPDDTFDKILMLYTYQYIKKPIPFISDVKKKLKKDGFFYVVNPQYQDYSNLDFQREEYGWNASPLEKEISDIISCGFELVKISRKYGDFDDPYMMVFRIKD
ncbi:MAG: methyltransferase domain-containing protein [Bacteroidota bacterium]